MSDRHPLNVIRRWQARNNRSEACDPATPYSATLLISVLTKHQRTTGPPPYTGGCTCGWGQRPDHLGRSWSGHVAAVYEQAARGEAPT